MRKKVKTEVVQQEGKEIAIEVLASEIQAISTGIKKLRSGRLTDRALFLLIQHAAPKVGGRHGQGSIGIAEIRGVVQGMESLEKEFLK